MPQSRADRRTVLVVARDATLRAAMARILLSSGYGVELAEGDRRARELVGGGGIDLAIVDPGPLGEAGPALTRELHDRVGRVVVLGSPAAASRRAAPDGLSLAHPLHEEELLGRVRQALAPTAAAARPPGASLLRFAGRTIDIEGRVFFDADGAPVPLTRAEFALLLDLADNAGRVRSREQLRQSIAGEELEAFERSIDMHVSRLRRKLEPDPRRPRFVVTVPGAGYKLATAVERSAAAAPEPAAPRSRPMPAPERRLLTVLSCTIDGLARIADERDPEEVSQATQALGEVCGAVVARLGGVVARFAGDSVTAYFGYPQAHEDDVERAVRAALALTQAASRSLPGGLRASIGIASGSAVVGDLAIGDGGTLAAIGDASRLAERLSAAAAGGSVVVGPQVRRAAGRNFRYRRLEPVRVEGLAEPVPAWRVLGHAKDKGRFAARRGTALTSFTGREEEIVMLRQRWRQACAGDGQVVLLIGEPGIGKSRLVHELLRSIGGGDHFRLRCFGSPHYADSPFFPVLRQLERAAGFSSDDAPQRKLEKLRALLAPAEADAETDLPLLAALLSVPHPDEHRIRELTPQRRKAASFALLQRMVDRLAAARPVVMAWEDAHWLDSLSLELLAAEVERAARRPLLVVVTARPEFAPPWPEHAHVRRHSVCRLDRADSEALVRHLVGGRLAEPAIHGVVERGDGVPLFLEELAKAELARAADGGRSGPVPVDLEGLLLERIDGLGPAGKTVAQAGAAIGRSFPHELLRLAAPGEPLEGGLARLVASELVFRRGIPPETTYEFKHMLVRDAAYSTLSRRRRRELHARIAAAIETRFADVAETQPELLAHHFRQAGNAEKAVNYSLAAAERALARSAFREARAQLAPAHEALPELDETDGRRRLELRLQGALGRAMMATEGYTAPATVNTYLRSQVLCEELNDQATLAFVLFGHCLSAWTGGDLASALAKAEELRHWGEREGVRAGIAVGRLMAGIALVRLGRLDDAQQHIEEALAIGEFTLPGKQPFLASDADGWVTGCSYLHNCLFLRGWPGRASAIARRSLAEPPKQLYSLAMAYSQSCRICQLERDIKQAGVVATDLCRLAEEHGYTVFIATGMVYRGWALARSGAAAEGIALCAEGIARAGRMGGSRAHFLFLLAECYESEGDVAAGLRALDEALDAASKSGERVSLPELFQLKARLLLRRGSSAEGEACFAAALAAARNIGARLLELRAATDYADFLAKDGRRQEARQVLSPALAAFPERSDCVDLREAERVLAAAS